MLSNMYKGLNLKYPFFFVGF